MTPLALLLAVMLAGTIVVVVEVLDPLAPAIPERRQLSESDEDGQATEDER